VLLRADGWQPLGQSSTMLGESPEAKFERFVCQLQPGETLAIFTDSVRDALDAQGRVFGEAGVADALQGKLDRTAAELVAAVQSAFAAHAAKSQDRSILVIKRAE
jgi:sigma-B regulation protein RsbU (phosphoserine phosphatase)